MQEKVRNNTRNLTKYAGTSTKYQGNLKEIEKNIGNIKDILKKSWGLFNKY